jgi:oxysterol-binding protein-related protein 9/10/11
VSSSGYLAKVDYSGRGWISGKKNSFTATLSKYSATQRGDKVGEPLYTVEGQWTEAFTMKEGKGGKSAKVVGEWNPHDTQKADLTVAPIEEQDELESRRAWQRVAQAIYSGDMDAVSHHKSTIENSQRDMRKKEREEGREWERRFFKRAESNVTFEELAAVINEPLEPEKTDGVWLWDAEKAKEARPPFRSMEYY